MKPSIALAVVALTGLLAPAQDSGPLRWKFKTGEKFYLQNEVEVKQTIVVMGNEVKQEQKKTSVTRFTVKKVHEDGSVVLEQKILDIRSRGNINEGNTADKLKGTVFTVTLGPTHEVIKLEGYADFLEKATGGNDEAKKVLAATLSEDTFKQALGETFSQMPGKPMKKNGTWERNSRLSMGPIGDMAVKASYKYVGKDETGFRSAEKITFTATLKYSPPKNQAQGLPFQIVKGNLQADKFEGTIIFDAKAGRMIQSTTTTKMTGKMTLSIQGQEVEMEMVQNQTHQSRFFEKEPKLSD